MILYDFQSSAAMKVILEYYNSELSNLEIIIIRYQNCSKISAK